ncbi:ComEA family DNA-binding protein [uncultured Hymenobacter sp.]|uniref:ComEA family DNA-binding protein n=1 Tax=uncultured Hymenobacter sp. TaxID=170016 RepID=UPI0035CA9309
MAASPVPRPSEPFGAGPRWRWLRRYFGFSRGETRGFIVLLLLMLGAAVAPRLLRPAAPVYEPAADQQVLNQLVARLQAGRAPGSPYPPRAGEAGRYGPRGSRFAPVAQVRLAPFDPNQLTALDWEARGVPHFVAGRIEKYGKAAGGFRAKSQLQRIYGLPDSVYQRLAPFVLLPDELPRREYGTNSANFARTGPGGRPDLPPFPASKYARKPRNLAPFDLNQADTTQLMQIRGIGAGGAKWIVRRRDELGGFVSEAQLADVFVLRDAPDLQDSLRKYTFVAAGFQPAQLNVNTASFEEMALHPYIGKRLGRVIVAFRKQHPPFQQAEDLLQIRILSEEDLAKMRPYVRFE